MSKKSATIAAVAAVAVAAAAKAPSKVSQANAIFDAKMTERKQGLFASNKEFRAAVLNEIKTKLEVSTASAATMYNSAKKAAEAADPTVGLGRDPKKEKPVSTGKKGRPAGSKNKAKEVVVITPAATEATETAPATEAKEAVAA